MRVRLVPVTSALLIALLIASITAQDTALPMPSLVGEMTIPVPLPFITPIIVVCAALAGLERGDRRLESTSSRVVRWDVAFILGLFLISTVVVLLVQLFDEWGMGAAFVRNLTGYVGLGLIARYYLGGPVAAVVPVIFVLICTAIGLDERRQPQPWAWPLAPTDDFAATMCCALLGAAGLYGMTRPTTVTALTRQ